MKEPHVRVCGGTRLEGEIRVQGAKNSALPVMAACLLTEGRTILYHCPKISDVQMMASIMEQIGCGIQWLGENLVIDTSGEIASDIPRGEACCFRGSSMLLGALLGRSGRVRLEEPGGCRIGKRPLNYHFLGFRKLGVHVKEEEDGYDCSCGKMHGAVITLPYPSVGATENLMLAASRAAGVTVLKGCAREPEIWDLAAFLIHMGVKIEGTGTSVLKITGKEKLCAARYYMPYDRIAAATYLFGGLMTKGDVTLNLGEGTLRMENILPLLEGMGARIIKGDCKVRLKMDGIAKPVRIETGPHPGIPTDIQPMILGAMLTAAGPSSIYENVFDARFQVCKEFEKMGGKIQIENNCARIIPVRSLTGTSVHVTDLRGGAALVLAGLAAEGETKVHSFSYVERGYEDFTWNLSRLGAQILS